MANDEDKIRRYVRPAVWAALVGLAWCALSIVMGDRWWLWDLFSHFVRIWYWAAAFVVLACLRFSLWRELAAAGLLASWFAYWGLRSDGFPAYRAPWSPSVVTLFAVGLGFMLSVAEGRRRNAIFLTFLLVAVMGKVTLGYMRLKDGPEAADRAIIRYANALYTNQDPASVALELAKPAELVAVVEESPSLHDELVKRATFRDELRLTGAHAASYGLYSRAAFASKETLRMAGYPVGHAVTGSGLNAYVVHPFPPMSESAYALQKEFFRLLADRLAAHDAAGEQFIIVGDFNSTPFSPTFRRALGKWALRPTYSWNVDSVLSIPIDHVLTNLPGLRSKYGPKTSSDHVPVAVYAQHAPEDLR